MTHSTVRRRPAELRWCAKAARSNITRRRLSTPQLGVVQNGLLEVLHGNPGDDQQVEPSLERHKENFGRAPELYSSDRGFFSETNVKSCKQKGVKVVCIPQRGGKKTAKRKAYEKSPAFKEGQRFRAELGPR